MKIKKIYRFFRYILIHRHVYGITSPFRVLPDFIIIGAKRCGTTSLYMHLGEHPSIVRAQRDNVGFFNNNFDLGMCYYRSFFPTIWKKKYIISKEKQFMTFDVTTSYLPNSITAVNICDSLPKIKLILIVRNPVDRTYSEYNLIKKEDRLNTFEELISKEIHQIHDEDNIATRKSTDSPTIGVNSLIRKGMYAQQFSPWLKLFSKDQILVISTEDFALKTQETYNEIFNFLGLPHHTIMNNKKINEGVYAPMKPEIRKLLVDYFKPYNKNFFEQVGQVFDWDK